MILTNLQKNNIINILEAPRLKDLLYAGLSDKERAALGMVYTPAKLCIQMLEMSSLEDLNDKKILDPACGSGNLLLACLAVGANSNLIFGNDYNKTAVELCRLRLNIACELLNIPKINDFQIHQGNALQSRCLYDFTQNYLDNYNTDYIDDLKYAQSFLDWSYENELAKKRNIKNETLKFNLF